MSIALTGASGQLGRLVIEELLTSGVPANEVVAIVRDPAKATAFADRGVQIRQADYADQAAWRPALEGVDRLLLISVSGAGASDAHRSVIDAAADTGVGHIAYTSILHADHTSNPLAPEHAATERLIAATGIPATMLRTAWYHELYTRMLRTYLATGEVVGSTGDGRISGAARADFAASASAVLLADDAESRTYELGGPAFTLADLAQTITAVTGTPVVNRNLTNDEHVAELRSAGMDSTSIHFVAGTDASIAAGEMETDSDALTRLIGRAPRTLAESVRQAL
ncbi:NAD(P)H-binding protein [Streptomyces sp. NPDC001037]|uniref:NAD(P)H-binding protein n=1 Tax=Streptomyces sp. NPDC001037 TaxID=3364542 RepID=UPI0036A7838D